MASLVPEPMEKCAVWAASPRSTMLPCRQDSLRTVVKLIHLELLTRTSWPSSSSAKMARMASTAASSLSPGRNAWCSVASKPALRQTSSCISTMKVLPSSEYG